MHTENAPLRCAALVAQWLSGVSGLISKQADLILMPCRQLFSPESLKAVTSSHELTDTTCSWFLAGHSPPFFFYSTKCHSQDDFFFLECETTIWFTSSKQRSRYTTTGKGQIERDVTLKRNCGYRDVDNHNTPCFDSD